MTASDPGPHELTEQEFLDRYDPVQFPHPSVTVDVVSLLVTDEAPTDIRRVPEKVLRVLLVRRNEHPFLGKWALPGGFVRIDETLDHAVDRVLLAKTGLAQVYLEQLYTWGDVDRDPRTRVVSASYLALLDASALSLDPGADARWFTVRERPLRTEQIETEAGPRLHRTVQLTLTSDDQEELSATLNITRTPAGRTARTAWSISESQGLAFDHAKILHCALDRLRGKLPWTDVAFNLVPPLFTLKELQKVYEVILGRELLDMQFRRDMERLVLPTNEMKSNVGHRPARLYRFRPDWSDN